MKRGAGGAGGRLCLLRGWILTRTWLASACWARCLLERVERLCEEEETVESKLLDLQNALRCREPSQNGVGRSSRQRKPSYLLVTNDKRTKEKGERRDERRRASNREMLTCKDVCVWCVCDLWKRWYSSNHESLRACLALLDSPKSQSWAV